MKITFEFSTFETFTLKCIRIILIQLHVFSCEKHASIRLTQSESFENHYLIDHTLQIFLLFYITGRIETNDKP